MEESHTSFTSALNRCDHIFGEGAPDFHCIGSLQCPSQPGTLNDSVLYKNKPSGYIFHHGRSKRHVICEVCEVAYISLNNAVLKQGCSPVHRMTVCSSHNACLRETNGTRIKTVRLLNYMDRDTRICCCL